MMGDRPATCLPKNPCIGSLLDRTRTRRSIGIHNAPLVIVEHSVVETHSFTLPHVIKLEVSLFG
jgi:hypothetical protein